MHASNQVAARHAARRAVAALAGPHLPDAAVATAAAIVAERALAALERDLLMQVSSLLRATCAKLHMLQLVLGGHDAMMVTWLQVAVLLLPATVRLSTIKLHLRPLCCRRSSSCAGGLHSRFQPLRPHCGGPRWRPRPLQLRKQQCHHETLARRSPAALHHIVSASYKGEWYQWDRTNHSWSSICSV
jgi:hypothetical protein